jgi:hypothetical protein
VSDGDALKVVNEVLEGYAKRGVIRGLGTQSLGGGRAVFTLLWHHGREFELLLDPRRGTLRFPVLLPEVPARSAMDRELRSFVRSRHDGALPEHRRVDDSRAEVRVFNRGGDLSLTLKLKNGDLEYGARKLIHLVHEIFMDFLYDGRWRDYMEQHFDLPPDAW